MDGNLIEVRNLRVSFRDRVVLDGVNITVKKGEIYTILGKSGSGKTTLMRSILLLNSFDGTIKVNGIDLKSVSDEIRKAVLRSYGVMFQAASLFTSLTVGENIAVPLKENASLDKDTVDDIVRFKLRLVGLDDFVFDLYPSQLSGGMRKKAALARALVLDPDIIFLDEPTSGLDPVSADDFDNTIKKLNETMGITVVMITHDLATFFGITDRACLIKDKKILAEGEPEDILKVEDKWLKELFFGYRGRRFLNGA
ncbi:ABC transporter ATP-binding protein [Hippea jasoniae]|uniref:ABC transporter ATP-binding protein n=1 Tax=Hippea jasoniae TaxID=944479 RepID=UPI00055732ED|nr:ATP-binding cassette domain-containing protein [Hippea jasoniae]